MRKDAAAACLSGPEVRLEDSTFNIPSKKTQSREQDSKTPDIKRVGQL